MRLRAFNQDQPDLPDMHVIGLHVAPGFTPPSANAEPETGPPMKRNRGIDLQPFPTDPPALPTAATLPPPPQVPDSNNTHRIAELRASALELATAACPWFPDEIRNTSDLYALADGHLAYINGNPQP